MNSKSQAGDNQIQVARHSNAGVMRAPLALPAAGFMCGIALQDGASGSWIFAALVAVLGFAVAGWTLRFPPLDVRKSVSLLATSLMLLTAAAGMLRYYLLIQRDSSHLLRALATEAEDKLVRVRGEVISSPIIQAISTPTPLRYAVEPRTRFDIRVQAIQQRSGWTGIDGTLSVTVGNAAPAIAAGQQVELFGTLRALQGPMNPGEFDWRRRQLRRGIDAALWCPREQNVRLVDTSSGWTGKLAGTLRSMARQALFGSVSGAPEANQTVMEAILLGQRGRVEATIDETFVRAGVIHLLCASGMHVAWLAGLVWFVMFLCGAHYRTTAVGVAAAIILYAVIAEPNPPILRASVMGLLVCAAQWLRRPRVTFNWLCASALLFLWLQPGDLFDVGFQLSYGVVGGLILLAFPLIRQATLMGAVEVAPGVLLPPDPDELHGWRHRLRVACTTTLIVGVTAWLVGTPLVAFHFGRVSPWGWINSIIMSPIAAVTMASGLMRVVITMFFPSAEYLAAGLTDASTQCMVSIAGMLANLPWAVVEVPHMSMWGLAAYFVALFTVVISTSRARRIVASFAMMSLVMLWLSLPLFASHGDGALRIWSLAVGDGLATIIEMPDGRTWAFDLGTRRTGDVARTQIAPFLRERGIRRLDHVVVSHPDTDHYGAVASIAELVPIERVWLNRYFGERAERGGEPQRFLHAMADRGVRLNTVAAGDLLDFGGDVEVRVLWPDGDADLSRLEDNDVSTVLLVRYREQAVLLTADIMTLAQAALLKHEFGRVDVMMMPHHGSDQAANLSAFLEHVDADILIRSSGTPDRQTRSTLFAAIAGREYYNTADDGAVCVTLSDDGVTISTQIARETRGRAVAGP